MRYNIYSKETVEKNIEGKRDDSIFWSLPFKLKPAVKDYLWGGSRLNDDFNLGLDADPLAEAWVCSTHPDGESMVTAYLSDEACGNDEDGSLNPCHKAISSSEVSLGTLIASHPEMLGSHALALTDGTPALPILIKLIDAKKNLSVQVHPDDEYAYRYENGSLGKTEMWYVLDARPDSSLIYGFSRDVTPDLVQMSIGRHAIMSLLNTVKVHRNDIFMVHPGTVHAIGAGCLIAEIQESSNITYRLYDFDRTDKNGNKRPLHIDKALETANLTSSDTPRQPMRTLKYRPGYASELLARCKYFNVERMLLNTEVHRDLVSFRTESNSFHALLVVDGCGSISADLSNVNAGTASGLIPNIFSMNFFKGDCLFIPAESVDLKLHGSAQILDVSC